MLGCTERGGIHKDTGLQGLAWVLPGGGGGCNTSCYSQVSDVRVSWLLWSVARQQLPCSTSQLGSLVLQHIVIVSMPATVRYTFLAKGRLLTAR